MFVFELSCSRADGRIRADFININNHIFMRSNLGLNFIYYDNSHISIGQKITDIENETMGIQTDFDFY